MIVLIVQEYYDAIDEQLIVTFLHRNILVLTAAYKKYL
jgi:hypothetical protein